MLPVPLNSSKIISSILLPVSTKAVARIVNFRQQVKDVEYIRSAHVFRGGKGKDLKENEHKEN